MLSVTKYVFQGQNIISRTSINSAAVKNEINSIINNILNIYQTSDVPGTLNKPGKTFIPCQLHEAKFHAVTPSFTIYDNEVQPQNSIKSCKIQEGKFRSVPAPGKMTAAGAEWKVKSSVAEGNTLAGKDSLSSVMSAEQNGHEKAVSPVQCQRLAGQLLHTERATIKEINDPDVAAGTIVKAFRTFLFQRSHERMMLTGKIWQAESMTGVQDGVRELSKNNLRRLSSEIAHLNPQERKFLNTFMDMEMYATHSTPVNIKSETGTVNLFSRKKLIERNIIFNQSNSPEEDIRLLGNDDFVFLSLEIGDEPKKPSSRFGGTVFRFNFDDSAFFDNAWLSLVEMRFARTPELSRHVEGLTDAEYASLSKRTLDPFHTVFSGGDIKAGVIFSVIKDLRDHLSADSQDKILALTDEKSINGIVNGLYRPEIKVGRQFFAKNYMEADIKKDEKM